MADPRSGSDRDPDPDPEPDSERPIRTTINEGVLQVRSPGTRWLSSGWKGGFETTNAAYNVSVPTDFSTTDLDAYLPNRRSQAGFERSGPTLLTGVSLDHARGARSGPVVAIATAGLSNPATLPVASPWSNEPAALDSADGKSNAAASAIDPDADRDPSETDRVGTVNLIVHTERRLRAASITTLLASAVEAKTATLSALTGFSGTTSDAIVVGCNRQGRFARFAGSATPVGAATRACVRDAVTESLASRYPNGEVPGTVAEADHGITTTRRTTRFRLE